MKVNMTLVVLIPLVIVVILVGGVLAYRYMGPTAQANPATPGYTGAYNPYESATGASAGGLGTVSGNREASGTAAAGTDLEAELRTTVDDGGQDDFQQLEKDAATL